jgi:transcriptional regulator
MREHPFATLVVTTDQGLAASHIPCVLDPGYGTYGRLLVHLANANPVMQQLGDGRPVLVIFSGPQCYVTPDAYASPGHLPTWLFSTVHAYVESYLLGPEGLEQQLAALVAQEEGRLDKRPWTLDQTPPTIGTYFRTLITAFELRISRLETTFKFNQHKNPADLVALRKNLEQSGDSQARQVSQLIAFHEARAKPEDIQAYKQKYRMDEKP